MTTIRILLQLIGAQLRYGSFFIVLGWLILLSAGLTASLTMDSVRQLGKVWAVLTMFAGMGLSVYLWSVDVRERRVLGWWHMPLSPVVIAISRLAVPIVLHALILIPFALSTPLWFDAADAVAVGAVLRVAGIHAFSLTMSMLIYLSEELTVMVYRWGMPGVIGMNVGFAAIILLGVGLAERIGLPELDSVPGMLMNYALGAVFAVSTVRFYARRANYLIGVDACTSMPVDWSSVRR